MDESKQNGLDETRRCLYMALEYLLDGEPADPELRGTIANALRHHHRELRLAPPKTHAEYQAAIDVITAELGDAD